MSSHRSSGNKHLHPDIRNYRDLAPESLSDEALLELVRSNGKNDAAIKEALVTLWNEEPRSEWISTDKKKLKKTASPPLPERGGRGRGRSAPPGRGEGGRGGRGGGRSSSVNISAGRGRGSIAKVESTSPKPESVAKVDSTENLETNVETTPQPTKQISTPVPVAPVWGNGVSLAQKLREAASAPPRPPTPPTPPSAPQPEPEPPVESSVEEVSTSPDPVSSTFAGQSKRSPRGADAGRGRGRRRAYRDHPHARVEYENNNKDSSQETETPEESVEELSKALGTASLESESIPTTNDPPVKVDHSHHTPAIADMVIMSPVRGTTNTTVSDNIVGSPVLKMGRWGAPIEATDASSFQFGSFGNLGDVPASDNDGDESPHKIASGLISSLSESQSTWGQQAQLDQNLSQSDRESESVSASLSVWGNSQPQNDNTEDYGYDQQVSNSANDSAPPGLGLGLGGLDGPGVVSQAANKSNNNNRNNRSAPGSQTRKTDMDNNLSRQSPQYYQPVPPGIQPGFGMTYYGFDIQQPSTGYGAPPQGSPSPSPGTSGSNTSQSINSNNNNQNGSNYNAGANANAPKYPGPPGMPAQMGAPYPPYYGNPYYQQAFYYGGGQPQNFYGRGQGMYPPRPYGADPYQAYDMYAQPGQFGDYGQMPMPPMHPQQGPNDRQGGKGKSTGQNSQSAGAVGSAPGSSNVGQTNQADVNQAAHGYGMGGYNYARPDQNSGWAPYQPYGMMPFPGAPGLGAGYSPMGGAPAQSGNNRQGGGSYNSYGRGSGGSSGNVGDSSGIGSAGSGTSNW